MYSALNEYIFDIIGVCNLCVSGGEPYSEKLNAIREKERSVKDFPTLLTLQSTFGLSDCEIFCVMLAFGCELDGGLRNKMKDLCGVSLPSFDSAFSIWSNENSIMPDECIAAAHSQSPLSLFILEDRGYVPAMMNAPLKLRESILFYLTAGRVPPARYYRLFQLQAAMPLHTTIFTRLYGFAKAILKTEKAGYIYLRGKAGTGRRSLASRVAAELGLRLMLVNINDIPDEKDVLRRLSYELAADTALSWSALYIDCYASADEEKLIKLLEFLPQSGILLFVAGLPLNSPPHFGGRLPHIEDIGAMSSEDILLVAESLSGNPLPDNFPSHLRLSVSELTQAVQLAGLIASNNGTVQFTAEDFTEAARKVVEQVSNSQTLDTHITLDDIILAPDTRKKLDLLCGFIRKSESVRERWGFSRLQAYGKGIVGLFCGASGTGKTMAANAVANDLGLKLMRIDISKVFDKYIGETEKRLSQLFIEADSQNCILFFDEADALFSKRTEVSSSHDRYANVETSFLLQCIEEFSGVTILSTNLFQNFDEAFMRRITVIVRFSMPGKELRYDMWKRFFPQQTPLADDVDLKILAQELELSPAVIKAAAFTAAILASEDGEIVTMKHIVAALENEMCKWGKESMLKEFEIAYQLTGFKDFKG